MNDLKSLPKTLVDDTQKLIDEMKQREYQTHFSNILARYSVSDSKHLTEEQKVDFLKRFEATWLGDKTVVESVRASFGVQKDMAGFEPVWNPDETEEEVSDVPLPVELDLTGEDDTDVQEIGDNECEDYDDFLSADDEEPEL